MKPAVKRLLLLNVLLGLIFFSEVIFELFFNKINSSQKDAQQKTILPKATVEIADFTSENYTTLPTNKWFAVELIAVIDGDTVLFSLNDYPVNCRLIGIDTPESQKKNVPVQPYALEAAYYTEFFLTETETIFLELDLGLPLDHYDRLLVHVFNHHGESLQEKLLEQGLGRFVNYPATPNKYQDIFEIAEKKASANNANIWQIDGYVLPKGFSTETNP